MERQQSTYQTHPTSLYNRFWLFVATFLHLQSGFGFSTSVLSSLLLCCVGCSFRGERGIPGSAQLSVPQFNFCHFFFRFLSCVTCVSQPTPSQISEYHEVKNRVGLFLSDTSDLCRKESHSALSHMCKLFQVAKGDSSAFFLCNHLLPGCWIQEAISVCSVVSWK